MSRGSGKRGPDKQPRKPGSGGYRPGAGRPPGVGEVLPRGAVAAIKAANAADTEDPLGQEALGVTLSVMRGEVHRGAMPRLMAARDILDRRRGKPKQELEHSGSVSITVESGIESAPGARK